MEVFIGNRIEVFRMSSNGLYNIGGSTPSSYQQQGDQPNEAKASSMFKLDREEESLLLHCLLEEENDAMNDQVCLDFNNDFSFVALKEALSFLVRKYDDLRAIYVFDQYSVPVKKVFDFAIPMIKEMDCSKEGIEQNEQRARTFMKEDKERLFNFISAPLFNLTLLKIDDQHFRLVWTCHEIALTKICLNNLRVELWNLYNSFSNEY